MIHFIEWNFTENFSNSDQNSSQSNEFVGIWPEPFRRSNTGGIDAAEECQLQAGVEECYAQQDHVSGFKQIKGCHWKRKEHGIENNTRASNGNSKHKTLQLTKCFPGSARLWSRNDTE